MRHEVGLDGFAKAQTKITTSARSLSQTASEPAKQRASSSIFLPIDAKLRTPTAMSRLAKALKASRRRHGIGRRGVSGLLGDLIYSFEGKAFWPNGKSFEIGPDDIEDAFSDFSARWITEFEGCAVRPPKQRAHRKIMPRLRFIWLALVIDARKGDGPDGEAAAPVEHDPPDPPSPAKTDD